MPHSGALLSVLEVAFAAYLVLVSLHFCANLIMA